MNFNTPKIFGFGVADNSAVDDCLSAISTDNKIFNRSVYDDTSFKAVFKAMADRLKAQCSYSSLAVIGLIDYAIKHQMPIADSQLVSLEAAKCLDPLSQYQERSTEIRLLMNQLSSHLQHNMELKNEYCA